MYTHILKIISHLNMYYIFILCKYTYMTSEQRADLPKKGQLATYLAI